MSLLGQLIVVGCTYSQKPTSVGYVSFWVVPGGWDYVNAYTYKLFFSEEERASVEVLVKWYEDPPEMAFLIMLTEEIKTKLASLDSNLNEGM